MTSSGPLSFWCRPPESPEESSLSSLVPEQKAYYDHPEGIQVRPVNLLSFDVSLPDAEAEFLGIGGVLRVDFDTRVDQGLNVVNRVDQLKLNI